jgi:hypothetical protein
MKSIIILVAAIVALSNCGNNKAASTEQPIANITATENKEVQATSSTPSGDDMVGTWKLRLEVYDDNGNRIPDEEEMKKGYSNNYMFQFNADGTCRIQQIFTGRYEKKTEKGRPMLYVYRKRVEKEEEKDPPPDIFQITSIKKDELVLQVITMGDPSSFWFFKRIN